MLAGCACSSTLHAQPLSQRIPQLFGGTLRTSITPRSFVDVQRPLVADRFRGLSAALASAHSQAPIPSATGAFRFYWDDDLESYVRGRQSLGPQVAERAPTLGRHSVAVSVAYSRLDFDSWEGDRLSHLRTSQPALSKGFLEAIPAADRLRAADNTLDTQLRLSFVLNQFFITAAYGLTDSIDASVSLSMSEARMRASAMATIRDPRGDGGAFFTVDQPGAVVVDGEPDCDADFSCARDQFSASAFGTGDVFLRVKWQAASLSFADFAVAAVLTLPTGNADDFLGFHDVTFTPWLIASADLGRVSPHLNLGYSSRSGRDVSQAQWIIGADVLLAQPLTFAADFIGFHDDKRDDVNDDVIQSAVGFKINPFGQFVFAATVQFPLNRDGLRADAIYSGQIEHTF